MNAGPARLPQWMVTLDYCRELGVPVEVFTNVNADAYLYNESAGMTEPMRYRTAKADVYGYVSELLAKATDKGALDKELTATDQERLVEFLKDFGDLGDKLDLRGRRAPRIHHGPGRRRDPRRAPRRRPVRLGGLRQRRRAATSPSSSASTRRC